MKHLSNNDFNDNLLENVPDGVNPQDAVNKGQLDTSLSGKANSTHTHSVADLTATGITSAKYLRGDNTWATPPDTIRTEISELEIILGTSSIARAISGRRVQAIVDKAIIATKEALYPVGSTYFNKTNSTNPADLLGFGAWARLEGVVLGGRSETSGNPFNVAGGTVIGEDEHTLTVAEMPSHNHPPGAGTSFINWTSPSGNIGHASGSSLMGAGSTGYTGGGDAHNNIQRTLVGYLWERTA